MRKSRFTHHLQTPTTWRKPAVLAASLGINTLALGLPMVILQVYDRIIPTQAVETFVFLIAGLFVVIVLDFLLKTFRSYLVSWEAARFDHRESLNAMNRVLDAETNAFHSKPTGFYIDRMQALEQIQEFHSGHAVLLVMDLPFVVIFLGLIWVIAGPLILIPVVLLAAFLVVSVVTGRRLRGALEARSRCEDARQNFIIETLNGVHTVKSMAMESLMMRRYERIQKQSAESVFELSRVNSVVQGIGATFSQLAVVCFAGIGSYYVVGGTLTIGALAAGTMLSSRVLQPGLSAMSMWTQFQSVRLAHDKVDELYALPAEQGGKQHPADGLAGDIVLRDVHFTYPHTDKPVLRGASLEIKSGECIGITGANGAGKSTLINLLAGFLCPDSGTLMLDGHNIYDYDLETLRAGIGIVPQRGILFEGTILENMTLYREGDAVQHAIELSHLLGLDEIISRMPDGLDTRVGGAAVDAMPEGVRQKIIMVRSLVGHPKVILFDDANANFDIPNDMRLQRLIARIRNGRTMVIVSHRPSFLRLCHRQYELADGILQLRQDTHSAAAVAAQSA